MPIENYRKMGAFIDAIKYLAKNSNGYDIVLRPHPVENIETWRVLLEDIPNVFIRKVPLIPGLKMPLH